MSTTHVSARAIPEGLKIHPRKPSSDLERLAREYTVEELYQPGFTGRNPEAAKILGQILCAAHRGEVSASMGHHALNRLMPGYLTKPVKDALHVTTDVGFDMGSVDDNGLGLLLNKGANLDQSPTSVREMRRWTAQAGPTEVSHLAMWHLRREGTDLVEMRLSLARLQEVTPDPRVRAILKGILAGKEQAASLPKPSGDISDEQLLDLLTVMHHPSNDGRNKDAVPVLAAYVDQAINSPTPNNCQAAECALMALMVNFENVQEELRGIVNNAYESPNRDHEVVARSRHYAEMMDELGVKGADLKRWYDTGALTPEVLGHHATWIVEGNRERLEEGQRPDFSSKQVFVEIAEREQGDMKNIADSMVSYFSKLEHDYANRKVKKEKLQQRRR